MSETLLTPMEEFSFADYMENSANEKMQELNSQPWTPPNRASQASNIGFSGFSTPSTGNMVPSGATGVITRSYASNGGVEAIKTQVVQREAPNHRTGRSGNVLSNYGEKSTAYIKNFKPEELGQGQYVDAISAARIKQTEEGRAQAAYVQSATIVADTAHINKDTKAIKRDTAAVRNAIATVKHLQAVDQLAGEVGKLHIEGERIGLDLIKRGNNNHAIANQIATQEAKLTLEGKPASVSFIDVNLLPEAQYEPLSFNARLQTANA